jgi:hypothetical protein
MVFPRTLAPYMDSLVKEGRCSAPDIKWSLGKRQRYQAVAIMMPCGPVTGGLNKKPVPQNEQTKHWKGKLQNQNFQTLLLEWLKIVEHLLSKYEVLSSNPNSTITTKKKQKKQTFVVNVTNQYFPGLRI